VNSRDLKCVYDVVESDANGQVVVSYTKQLQSTTQQNFTGSCHLAVNKSNECILVADKWNNIIVKFSRSLKCLAHEFNVMSVVGRLEHPSCFHFNESQDRLFVGEDSGLKGQRRVLVLDNVIYFPKSLK
jgi:hypothetical protein